MEWIPQIHENILKLDMTNFGVAFGIPLTRRRRILGKPSGLRVAVWQESVWRHLATRESDHFQGLSRQSIQVLQYCLVLAIVLTNLWVCEK